MGIIIPCAAICIGICICVCICMCICGMGNALGGGGGGGGGKPSFVANGAGAEDVVTPSKLLSPADASLVEGGVSAVCICVAAGAVAAADGAVVAAGPVPTPNIAFKPCVTSCTVGAGAGTGAVGGGGGAVAAASAATAPPPDIPSIAFNSMALFCATTDGFDGLGRCLDGVCFPLLRISFRHLAMPLLPAASFLAPLKPIPFSGGPCASFHPACLLLESERVRPADAVLLAEPARPVESGLCAATCWPIGSAF
mmetsp:Transcript_18502/g.52885  ORF Transcript_18502/g.52885 Transcript_18502/m.52885 type:complete len:254 (+) Transcript_18502:781-1542(+)